MGKAEERRLADKAEVMQRGCQNKIVWKGMTQVRPVHAQMTMQFYIIARPNQYARRRRGNELAPLPEHGNRCTRWIEPQKAGKSLTSMTGIFLLRPVRFDEL